MNILFFNKKLRSRVIFESFLKNCKLIIGEVGIKMSWVEKNRKTNNRVGDDYSGLESIRIVK